MGEEEKRKRKESVSRTVTTPLSLFPPPSLFSNMYGTTVTKKSGRGERGLGFNDSQNISAILHYF